LRNPFTENPRVGGSTEERSDDRREAPIPPLATKISITPVLS